MDNGAMDICRQKGSSIKYSPKGALVFLSLTVGIYLAIFVGFVEKGQTASYPSYSGASSSTTQMDSGSGRGSKGFLVDLAYTNITDIHAQWKSTSKKDGSTLNEHSDGTTHVGAAGPRVGYQWIWDLGLGLDTKLGYYSRLNKSESTDEFNFVVPEVNFRYLPSRLFGMYIGMNYFDDVSPSRKGFEKLKGTVGLQTGLNFLTSFGMKIDVGYLLLSGYQDIDTPYSTGRDDIQMGGFFTAVGMVF